MAKTQKATLDPTKISGRCGRLMCCLRYEDTVYEELRKLLPKKNVFVRTEKLVGKVIDSQIITQLVRLLLPDGQQIVVANEEILERGVTPPTMAPPPTLRPRPQPEEKVEPRLLREEWKPADAPQAQAAVGEGPAADAAVTGAADTDSDAELIAAEGPHAAPEGAAGDEIMAGSASASEAYGDDGDTESSGAGDESGAPATNQPPGQRPQGGPDGEGRRRRRRRRGRRQGQGGPQQQGGGRTERRRRPAAAADAATPAGPAPRPQRRVCARQRGLFRQRRRRQS